MIAELRGIGMADDKVARLRAELFGDTLTPEEVAAVLMIDRTTVMCYLRRHEIIGFQVGRRWHVPESELRAYIARLSSAHESKP